MDTREWIFVLGVIAVVIIALILAARWRRQRFDEIRPGEHLGVGADIDNVVSAELPAGSARTVGYRDPTDIERMNDEIRERAEASRPRLSSFRPEPVVQPSLLDDLDQELDKDDPLDQQSSVPLLLDPSDEHNSDQQQHATEAVQPDKEQAGSEPEQAGGCSEHSEELENPADDWRETEPEPELPADKDDPSTPVKSAAGQAPESIESPIETPAAKPEEPSAKPQEPGEIIIVNLMTAPSTPYDGATLLKLVTELGLRHGDMDIFHYCGRHGDEPPQFRMANLLKPGYFDINTMNQTRTHALCFFFELMPAQDNMKTYETMLSVINNLRDDLGGELHDENRSIFTIQTSEHCRNRIRDFQRRHLLTR